MTAYLELKLPWVDDKDIEGLSLRRASTNSLHFDDGISLRVLTIDPAQANSAEDLVERTPISWALFDAHG